MVGRTLSVFWIKVGGITRSATIDIRIPLGDLHIVSSLLF